MNNGPMAWLVTEGEQGVAPVRSPTGRGWMEVTSRLQGICGDRAAHTDDDHDEALVPAPNSLIMSSLLC